MNKLLCPICGGTLVWTDDDDYHFIDNEVLCLESRGYCADCNNAFAWEEIYQRIRINNITPINK